jgi:hypothetical protein
LTVTYKDLLAKFAEYQATSPCTLVHSDATFKLSSNHHPLLTCCFSDANGVAHPLILAVASATIAEMSKNLLERFVWVMQFISNVPVNIIHFMFDHDSSCHLCLCWYSYASKIRNKIIVGGILAIYQYDLRGKTDPHFRSTSGLNLIASEAKTHRAFGLGEMWYRCSRGIQLLSALYAFIAPTFLFTQRQWKLFVENTERNAILTFPYNDNPDHTPHVNSSLVQQIGTTFLKVIVICLLSRRVSLDESMKSITLQESSQVKGTPQKTIIKPKYFDTPEKPVRMSARFPRKWLQELKMRLLSRKRMAIKSEQAR